MSDDNRDLWNDALDEIMPDDLPENSRPAAAKWEENMHRFAEAAFAAEVEPAHEIEEGGDARQGPGLAVGRLTNPGADLFPGSPFHAALVPYLVGNDEDLILKTPGRVVALTIRIARDLMWELRLPHLAEGDNAVSSITRVRYMDLPDEAWLRDALDNQIARDNVIWFAHGDVRIRLTGRKYHFSQSQWVYGYHAESDTFYLSHDRVPRGGFRPRFVAECPRFPLSLDPDIARWLDSQIVRHVPLFYGKPDAAHVWSQIRRVVRVLEGSYLHVLDMDCPTANMYIAERRLPEPAATLDLAPPDFTGQIQEILIKRVSVGTADGPGWRLRSPMFKIGVGVARNPNRLVFTRPQDWRAWPDRLEVQDGRLVMPEGWENHPNAQGWI